MFTYLPFIKNKDWPAAQAYIRHNIKEYQHAIHAMKKYKEIDFKTMFMEDTELFIFFFNTFSKSNYSDYNPETFWILRNQAYYQLKKDEIIGLDLHEDKVNHINKFEQSCSIPAFIPLSKLKQTIYKQTSDDICFDYFQLARIIQQYYEIRLDSFFAPLELLKAQDLFSNYFPNYDEFTRISPAVSLEANYLSIISDVIKPQIPHINFWSLLLDSDFKNMSNGSSSYMKKPIENNNSLATSLTKKFHFKKDYLDKVKSVFFKELSQFDEIKSANKIKFLTSW